MYVKLVYVLGCSYVRNRSRAPWSPMSSGWNRSKDSKFIKGARQGEFEQGTRIGENATESVGGSIKRKLSSSGFSKEGMSLGEHSKRSFGIEGTLRLERSGLGHRSEGFSDSPSDSNIKVLKSDVDFRQWELLQLWPMMLLSKPCE